MTTQQDSDERRNRSGDRMIPIRETLHTWSTSRKRRLDASTRAGSDLSRPTTSRKPASLTPRGVLCTFCHDMGFYRLDVPVGHPEFGKAQRCPCQAEIDKARLVARAQRASNLSTRLLDKRFSTYQPTPGTQDAYERCCRFAKFPSGWLYLYGGPGTGKTHLLAAIANVLMHTTAAPLYVVVPDWLAYLRDGYDAGERETERYTERMQQAKTIPVLLLDDLGAEKRTVWTDEQLYRLLNSRYDEALPTVVSSNLLPDQHQERIASRLQDTELAEVITLGGADYRRRPRLLTDGQEA